ncbi:hypothetical protein B14911_14862 [Bacillus sp. NRRL B-14911]|nr:hypothetical protein B14911_14862 [Bacillus sp. NRRL B-14911]
MFLLSFQFSRLRKKFIWACKEQKVILSEKSTTYNTFLFQLEKM